jgi:hypothetical protein
MTVSKTMPPDKLLDVWIADSGANMHMSHNLKWFSSYKPITGDKPWPITAVAGHQAYVAGTGTIKLLVQLLNKIELISLENVLHIPGLQCNLFSTTLMQGCHTGRPEAFWRANRMGGRAALSIMPYMNRAGYCRQRNYCSKFTLL